MKNDVAWIDDVFTLTAKVQNITTVMKEAETPAIFWEAMDKYFPVKLGDTIDDTTVSMTFVDELPMGEKLTLHWGELQLPIYPGAIVRTDWFDQHYSDLDTELGAKYGVNATTFSVWAPTATCVKLCLNEQVFSLKRGSTWNLGKCYYRKLAWVSLSI